MYTKALCNLKSSFLTKPPKKCLLLLDHYSLELLTHVVEKRKDKRERFTNYILPTLEDPSEAWLTEYDDGSFRRRFIKLFSESDKQSLVIPRENRDASLFF